MNDTGMSEGITGGMATSHWHAGGFTHTLRLLSDLEVAVREVDDAWDILQFGAIQSLAQQGDSAPDTANRFIRINESLQERINALSKLAERIRERA